MPSVYRPAGEQIYCAKIGYHEVDGKRRRKEWRLGRDAAQAHLLAVQKEIAWQRELERHQLLRRQWLETFPSDEQAYPEPVWTEGPGEEAGAELRRLDEADPYDGTEPEDVAVHLPQGHTLQEAAQQLLARFDEKVGQGRRQPATREWYRREWQLGLVPGAIDPDLRLDAIRAEHVQGYCDYWSNNAARAAEAKSKSFTDRTALNRVRAIQFLLHKNEGKLASHQVWS